MIEELGGAGSKEAYRDVGSIGKVSCDVDSDVSHHHLVTFVSLVLIIID